ncbi:MAG: SMC-Scp complex subunit ScpB [Acidobacteriota bacterium]|nr:SMC-Scp complex subunit ScpB [Acidobacteriota bacterium]MDH3785284.1 SMC-Scp complex subunit ScpB [Acidobacteriota bacterium]
MSETKHPAKDQWPATIGAVLFASGEPVSLGELTDALGADEKRDVETALDELSKALKIAGLGLRVEKIAGGYQLATESSVGEWVRTFFRQRNRARLTPAALETLAIVAYRQPVTAPEIQSIRGKDPSAALKSLLDKKMLRVLGKKKVVGNPLLYGTSRTFLLHFGLDSLKELPELADFEEFVGVFDEGALGPFQVSTSGEAEALPAPEEEPGQPTSH